MFVLTYDLGYVDISWRSFSECHRLGNADDVGIKFTVMNFGEKPIKYCMVTCAPINRVGDYVACSITNEVGKQFRMVGPIEPGASGEYTFEKAWYNKTIHDVKDIKVQILYMDGSSETLTWEQILQNWQTAMPQITQLRQQQENQVMKSKAVGCIWGIISLLIVWALGAMLSGSIW